MAMKPFSAKEDGLGQGRCFWCLVKAANLYPMNYPLPPTFGLMGVFHTCNNGLSSRVKEMQGST